MVSVKRQVAVWERENGQGGHLESWLVESRLSQSAHKTLEESRLRPIDRLVAVVAGFAQVGPPVALEDRTVPSSHY